MLVGAFEIDVRRPFQVRTVFQREGMGRARSQTRRRGCPRPASTWLRHACCRGNAPRHRRRTRHRHLPASKASRMRALTSASCSTLPFFIGKDADRHAPGALTRQDPVRAGCSIMRAQAVLAGSRNEAGVVDGAERTGAQRRAVLQVLVHGDEPLRRVAEDDRLLGAPAVRILVLQAAAGEQRAGARSAP